jgi:RHS repeat-associated protein
VPPAYDAQGRRIVKHNNQGTTTFAWDGDRILSDQKQGQRAREFVFYPGTFEPLAAVDADKSIYYFNNDHIGAPQEVTDDQGKIVWSARYDATGGIEKLFHNTFDNPIRLQGQYADDELGLYYNRHRYFDPRIGAFISQDPLGIAAGENLYAYAPNVWAWVDPLGLMKNACSQDAPTGELEANPKDINFSQRSINRSFDTPDGKKSIEKVFRQGPDQVDDFPPIKVVDVKGKLVARDGNSR